MPLRPPQEPSGYRPGVDLVPPKAPIEASEAFMLALVIIACGAVIALFVR